MFFFFFFFQTSLPVSLIQFQQLINFLLMLETNKRSCIDLPLLLLHEAQGHFFPISRTVGKKSDDLLTMPGDFIFSDTDPSSLTSSAQDSSKWFQTQTAHTSS